MFLFGSVGSLVVLALWVFCLVDVITSDEHACRNLPKTMWLILVILLPLVGSVAWLMAGRPATTGPDLPYKGNTSASVAASKFPEYDRPGRHIPADPESDEEFLRRLRERAEEQRRAYREQQRRLRDAQEGEPTP
ncbi:MAG: PLDc N-terminal domain-containing protein [Aeromicrobium sp.]